MSRAEQDSSNSDYAAVVRSGRAVIDRTRFIREYLEYPGEVVCIAREPGTGRSFNASMLYYFLSCQDAAKNRALFSDTEIASAQDAAGHPYMLCQGKFPTILLSFKKVTGATYAEVESSMKACMAELYGRHQYLLNSATLPEYEKENFQNVLNQKVNGASLTGALRDLTGYLYHVHKTDEHRDVMIIIDDYDVPFELDLSAADMERVKGLVDATFNKAFKEGCYSMSAVLFGAQIVRFEGVNNISHDSGDSKYFQNCFGFTGEERAFLAGEEKEERARQGGSGLFAEQGSEGGEGPERNEGPLP